MSITDASGLLSCSVPQFAVAKPSVAILQQIQAQPTAAAAANSKPYYYIRVILPHYAATYQA